MNKIFATIITIFTFFIAPIIAGTIETTYTMNAEIVGISGDLVLLEDSTGEIWEFYGEGFHVGDNVKVRFFTNYTDNTRYDDEVEKVKII